MTKNRKENPETQVKHGWYKPPETVFTKKLAIFRHLAGQVLDESFDPVAHEIIRERRYKPRRTRKLIVGGKEMALDELCKLFVRDI